MAVKPWESLRFISKVEIVPAPGRSEVFATLQEDMELDEWHSDIINSRVVVAMNRRLCITTETVNFHYDYPDDFKKLVYAMDGDYPKAYEGYLALQKPVPANWEREPKNPWYGTPNDICDKDGEFDCDC